MEHMNGTQKTVLAVRRDISLSGVRGLLMDFTTSDFLVNTLLRISEYSCKEEFRRVFLVEEFMDRFNILDSSGIRAIMVTGKYCREFVTAYAGQMSEDERVFFDSLNEDGFVDSDGMPLDDDFFVIGLGPFDSEDERDAIFWHELSHVAYRFFPEYREESHRHFWRQNDRLRKFILSEMLTRRPYSRKEVINEWQAHTHGGLDRISHVFDGDADFRQILYRMFEEAVPA